MAAGETCVGSCLRWTKFGFVVALLVESLACVLLGAWIGRRVKALRFANALASGVFLASALIHIIPHASSLLNPSEKEAHSEGEHEEGEHEEGEHEEGEHEEGEHEEGEHEEGEKEANAEKGHEEHGHSGFPTANACTLGMILALVLIENILLARVTGGAHGHGDEKPDPAGPQALPADDDNDTSSNTGSADGSLPVPSTAAKSPSFFSAAFVAALSIVAAISVHSFFESVSFGLTPTFSGALTIFIAVAAHRWIVASAVLAKLYGIPGLRPMQRWLLFGAFVLVLPLGVGIGAALSSLPEKVEGVFVALSAGAFIYLGMEGIFEEFVMHRKWKLAKFLMLLVGAALIVVIEGILVATDNQI